MNVTRTRLAGIAALALAAAGLSTVLALPAAATTRTFTGYGISKENALASATQQCVLAGFQFAAGQCTEISDRKTSPGDDTWVAVVQGSN